MYEVGGRRILDGVTFSVACGELVALVGPNGAGKSTVFGATTGDVRLDAGRVRLFGDDITSLRATTAARRRAVQLQENHVSYGYFVQEVVEMGRRPWRGTAHAADDAVAVHRAVEVAALDGFVARDVMTLSGGERARTAFARTHAQRSRLVMLDEPTAALDIGHQEIMLRETRALVEAGAAAITVLHDLNLAAAYADRVLLMRDGAIIASGTPREVLRADLISEVYETPVDVFEHPGAEGGILVLPKRGG